MGNDTDRGGTAPGQVSRRNLLSAGAAGAVALAAAPPREAGAQAAAASAVPANWDRTADVVVIGAGVAGLPAAIMARDLGASVIVVDENFDIGGRGILSGGRVHLGGGHALQQKAGIKDLPDQVFADWTRHDTADARYSDRDLVRVFADENVPTFNFLIDNGVKFNERPIGPERASTVPRTFVTVEWPIASELIAPGRGRNGSGLVRQLAIAARQKGAEILLRHEMKSIVREGGRSGKVLGITAVSDGKTIAIRARKGVIIATGGHTGNVNFRRTFDPRLTEEYQQACMPYVHQGADGELAAMELGAALWATANQTAEAGAAITKTRHIGCRWGYATLVYQPESPMFHLAKATGLTVRTGRTSSWSTRPGSGSGTRRTAPTSSSPPRWRRAATAASSMAAARSGRSSMPTPPHGRNGTRSRRTSIRTASSSAPIRSANWRAKSAIRTKKADVGGGTAGDHRPLQRFRRRRRRPRLQETRPDVQDREAAVLCGVVDPDPARHAHGPAHQPQYRGRGYPRRGDPKPLLRRRIARRLRSAWARPLPGVWPCCRPACGAASGMTAVRTGCTGSRR